MQIFIETTTPDTVLIPVEQTDSLVERLATLAQTLNVPAATLEADFKADAKELVPFYHPDGRKTYLLGLGKEPAAMDWLKTFREVFFKQKNKLSAQTGVDLTGFGPEVIEAVVLGIRAGGYDLRLYQTDKPALTPFYSEAGRLSLFVNEAEQASGAGSGGLERRPLPKPSATCWT